MKKVISLICLMIVLPVFLAAADEEAPDEETQKLHFIHIDNGMFMDDQMDTIYYKTTREDVANMVKNIDKNTVVVHFHGGLVDEKSAFERPMKKGGIYEAYSKDAYPIFFAWRSGFMSTIDQMYDKESDIGQIIDAVKKVISARTKKQKRLISGDDEIINNFIASVNFRRFWFLWHVWKETLLDRYYKAYNKLTPAEQGELKEAIDNKVTYTTNDLKNCLGGTTGTLCLDKIISVVSHRLFQRTIEGRHHNLTATLQEESWNSIEILSNFINDGWGKMKCITFNAFQDDHTKYGGTAFLKELNDLIGQKPDTKVILVGHSTGAEYICNLLEDAARADKYPLLNKEGEEFTFDVIFEAPACTFERFNKTLTTAVDKIENFRMFALHDCREKKDSLAGDKYSKLFYSNSLLYFVASVPEPTRYNSSLPNGCETINNPPYEYLDKPILGMERYFFNKPFDYELKYPEVKSVKSFLGHNNPVVEIKTVFSKSKGADGWKITAKKHGQCDDNKKLLESLQHIIKFGFETN